MNSSPAASREKLPPWLHFVSEIWKAVCLLCGNEDRSCPLTHRWSLNARGGWLSNPAPLFGSRVELALTYWSIKSQLANIPLKRPRSHEDCGCPVINSQVLAGQPFPQAIRSQAPMRQPCLAAISNCAVLAPSLHSSSKQPGVPGRPTPWRERGPTVACRACSSSL